MLKTIGEKVYSFFINLLFTLTNRSFMNAQGTISGDSLLQFSHKEAALYIHFPFCDSICRYCPFSKTMNKEHAETYCKTLIDELELLKNRERIENTSIDSLYFGGGTPSLMPIKSVEKILNTCTALFGTIPQITMECNPDSLTATQALEYKRLGITRLSIGVQSFQQGILQELGRKSRPIAIKQLISDITAGGFTNISIDLIYGFSQQSDEMFLSDIGEAITLGVEHISLFPLINTKKGKQSISSKQFRRQLQRYSKAKKYLKSHGFTAYSIEDFARTERSKNRYQEAVWKYPQKDLIILGSAAFGMVNGANYFKDSNRNEYLEKITKHEFPLHKFYLSSTKAIHFRQLLMGLHYQSIVLADSPKQSKRFRLTIAVLGMLKLLKKEGTTISLTEEGAFVTSLFWAKIMLNRMN